MIRNDQWSYFRASEQVVCRAATPVGDTAKAAPLGLCHDGTPRLDRASLFVAELSEPVKPIVYYVDPATPTKWIPWIKKGIEDWQPAFEAAGFKNAIIAKEAPSKSEDPNWDPEDARYSVIRYLPSTIENASGPHVNDPRTGEILESDIQYYHNVMNLLRNWYFVQVGPLDPRARTLPLPDELMGRLIEYVAAHEVGHTLGFQHNMKASSMYPQAKLRDAKWLKEMSHTPTLMDYARFTYVAQPEDNVDADDLVPRVGPYDKWATMWGYKPIPHAKTPEDEKKTLDEWAREQDATPFLRFSTAASRGADPGELTEAVGDEDLMVLAERFGAVAATGNRPAKDMLAIVARERFRRHVGAKFSEYSDRELAAALSMLTGAGEAAKASGRPDDYPAQHFLLVLLSNVAEEVMGRDMVKPLQ